MSARKLKQVFPSVLFLAAALIVMVIGIRNGDDYFLTYAFTSVVLAVFGLLLAMSLCSKKHHQKLTAVKQKIKEPKDNFFGEDQYGLFGKKPPLNGSLDDLKDDDINKKL